MFIQTGFPLRPGEAVLGAGQGGVRNDEVVALNYALAVELQFVIDRLIDAVHFRQAGVSFPVCDVAEDVYIRRLVEDSQDDPLARQFRRQLMTQAAAQFLRAADAFADEQSVAALIERDDAVREPAGGGGRAGLGAFQDVPADERAGLLLFIVKNVRRFGRDQVLHFLAAENDRAARVRDVAELVRINRHRVGMMNCAEALEDLFRRPRSRELADLLGGLDRFSPLIEEKGSDITAPRRVAVVIKGQSQLPHFRLKSNQAMNLIDRSFFRGTQDRDKGDNRYALARAAQEYFSHCAEVHAEMAVDRNQFDLLFAEAQGFDNFLHRIMRRRRKQNQRRRDSLVA